MIAAVRRSDLLQLGVEEPGPGQVAKVLDALDPESPVVGAGDLSEVSLAAPTEAETPRRLLAAAGRKRRPPLTKKDIEWVRIKSFMDE